MTMIRRSILALAASCIGVTLCSCSSEETPESDKTETATDTKTEAKTNTEADSKTAAMDDSKSEGAAKKAPDPPNLSALFGARDTAVRIRCANNLKMIYVSAAEYAFKYNRFPRAKATEAPAHEHFQALLETRQGASLEPDNFICRGTGNEAAKADADGRFTLDADSCDYAWTSKVAKPSQVTVPLAACAHHVKSGVVLVLYTDGSVLERKISEAEAHGLDKDNGYLPTDLVK